MKNIISKISIIFIASILFVLVACGEKQQTLATPNNLKVVEQKLAWDEVLNANYYEVSISDVEGSPFKVESNTFALYEKIVVGIEYTIQVQAFSNDEKFVASEKSAEFKHKKFGQDRLATPVTSYANNRLSWEAIPGAEEYLLEIGNYRFTTKETFFEDDATKFGVGIKYTAKITAIYKDNKELNSETLRTTYELFHRLLQKPTVTLEGSVASWEAIEYATSYTITIDNVAVSVSTLNVDILEKFPKLEAGKTYEVTIMSFNPSLVYLTTEAVTTINFTVPAAE